MEASPPIRVVIADDHPITVLGLRALFEGEPDVEVVATVADGREALRAVRELRPDVLLLDIAMPELDGFEVLRELHAEGVACKSLLYTVQMDDDRLLEAMRWGLRGVFLKTMPPPMLLHAVRKIHGGGQWLETESVGRVLENLLERDVARQRFCELLTPRELELVKVAAQGLRNQAIAERLHIQEGTVRIHLRNIYEKLGLDGRGALIAFAQKNGLA